MNRIASSASPPYKDRTPAANSSREEITPDTRIARTSSTTNANRAGTASRRAQTPSIELVFEDAVASATATADCASTTASADCAWYGQLVQRGRAVDERAEQLGPGSSDRLVKRITTVPFFFSYAQGLPVYRLRPSVRHP
eukprot:7106742-Prymnesium_polylepis.1